MAEDYRNQAIGVFELVSHTVIASPSEDTEKAIAMTINK